MSNNLKKFKNINGNPVTKSCFGDSFPDYYFSKLAKEVTKTPEDEPLPQPEPEKLDIHKILLILILFIKNGIIKVSGKALGNVDREDPDYLPDNK